MGVSESLRRAVGYLGGAESDYDDGAGTWDEPDTEYDEPPAAHRSSRERGHDFDDIYSDGRAAGRARGRDGRPLALVREPRLQFFVVAPQDFDTAQEIADRFRARAPVIIDLHGCEPNLRARLIDFCAGLTYALEGRLQAIDDKVLLLAPEGVDLSGVSGGILEKRFFNQS